MLYLLFSYRLCLHVHPRGHSMNEKGTTLDPLRGTHERGRACKGRHALHVMLRNENELHNCNKYLPLDALLRPKANIYYNCEAHPHYVA